MVYGIVPVDNMMRTICLLFPLLLVFPAVSGDAHGLTTENFIHHNEMKNWNDAQTHCRQHHTDLVTINSAEENQDFVAGQGWIGLYREDSNSEWKWSRRDEIADFTNWLDDNPKYGEDCAYKYPNTDKWESDPCNTRHTSMCYNERLVLVKEKKTWEQALRHCRALEAVNSSKPATDHQNHRYDLATLLTSDDHVCARKKAQGATTDEVWTGLRYTHCGTRGAVRQYSKLPESELLWRPGEERHHGHPDKGL